MLFGTVLRCFRKARFIGSIYRNRQAATGRNKFREYKYLLFKRKVISFFGIIHPMIKFTPSFLKKRPDLNFTSNSACFARSQNIVETCVERFPKFYFKSKLAKVVRAFRIPSVRLWLLSENKFTIIHTLA